jgi:hypothetical protein
MQERITLSEEIATSGTYHRITTEEWNRVRELLAAPTSNSGNSVPKD